MAEEGRHSKSILHIPHESVKKEEEKEKEEEEEEEKERGGGERRRGGGEEEVKEEEEVPVRLSCSRESNFPRAGSAVSVALKLRSRFLNAFILTALYVQRSVISR